MEDPQEFIEDKNTEVFRYFDKFGSESDKRTFYDNFISKDPDYYLQDISLFRLTGMVSSLPHLV